MTTSHHFLTQAVRRGYVTPNPVFLSLPPSGGVASLLSSQSHIPFGLLFRFQGAMKRSFTYSHWERSNSNPKREKYFEFEKSLHSFGQRVLKCTPIFGVFSKTFSKNPFTCSHWGRRNYRVFFKIFLSGDKRPFTYLELQSRMTPCFLKKSSNFFGMFGGQKKKAYGVAHTLPNRHIAGAIFASFLPCKAFSKGGKG